MSILRVGTLNLGNATADEVLDFMSWCDVAGLQEASDRQDDVLRALYAHGYSIVQSHDPGGKATPLVFNKRELQLLRRIDRPLLGSMWLGDGTGPNRNKPKRATGAVFRHKASGRKVRVVNVHGIVGQRHPLRRRAARLLVTRLMSYVGRPFRQRLDYVVGDMNTNPTSKVLDPLPAAGYRCNHLVLGWLPTWGRGWCPDQVWARGKRMRLVRHRMFVNSGDHGGLVVMALLKARRS